MKFSGRVLQPAGGSTEPPPTFHARVPVPSMPMQDHQRSGRATGTINDPEATKVAVVEATINWVAGGLWLSTHGMEFDRTVGINCC